MTEYRRIKRWRTVIIVSSILLVLTVVMTLSSNPHRYDIPVHLEVANASLTAVPLPEGQEEDFDYRFYQVDFDLTNRGGEPLDLDPYHFKYEPHKSDLYTRTINERDRANIVSDQFLPCGTTIHYSDVIKISVYGEDPADIFPLEIIFDDYNDEELLVTFEGADVP